MKQAEKIKQFWDWFVTNMDEHGLDLKADSTEYRALVMKIRDVDVGLVADVGKVGGKHELIVGSNGIKKYFGLVMEVVDEAPEMQYWQVRAFKPAHPKHIQLRYEGLYLSTSDMFYEIIKETHSGCELKVWFIAPQDLDQRYVQVAQIILLNKLGEYVYGTRVKLVSVNRVDQYHDYQGKLLPMVTIGEDERVVGKGGN